MCKNTDKENEEFWKARDEQSRAARDENGKIPGKEGVTICVSPEKSPQPQKKDETGPAPSPPVKKKERTEPSAKS